MTYISQGLETSVTHGGDISMAKLYFKDCLTLLPGYLALLDGFSTLLETQRHIARRSE